LEAFLGSLGLVEAAKDQNVLGVNRHAHGEVAGRPRTLGVEVDHSPHVVVDIVHFNRIRDFLLVKLGPARKHIDILILEDARGSAISGNIQVGNPAPGVILYVVFLAGRVEILSVIASNDKDEASL